MSINTTATFCAWEVVTARLQAIDYGTPATDNSTVAVWFGDPTQPNPDENGVATTTALEHVVIVGDIDAPKMEWGPMGNLARDEEFSFTVFVKVMTPGLTSGAAKDRLKAIVRLIELNIRAISAGRKTVPKTSPTEFNVYPVWDMAVAMVKPVIPPFDGGYSASAEITIHCQFRIGTEQAS